MPAPRQLATSTEGREVKFFFLLSLILSINNHNLHVGPIFGHVGDGNFHAMLLNDPEKPEELKACKEVAYRMAGRALEVGGTCTGEHGIGTGKIGLLKSMFGDVGIDTMWALKNAIDPKGIMNPGKVLPH